MNAEKNSVKFAIFLNGRNANCLTFPSFQKLQPILATVPFSNKISCFQINVFHLINVHTYIDSILHIWFKSLTCTRYRPSLSLLSGFLFIQLKPLRLFYSIHILNCNLLLNPCFFNGSHLYSPLLGSCDPLLFLKLPISALSIAVICL